jgi:ABC-type cobalt transport system substrate-binding protein
MNRTAITWTIIALVVVALLAYFALRNPDADLQSAEKAGNEIATSTASAIDRTQARAEAAADLTALQARIVAGETYASLSSEFAEVRANAAAAYDGAEGEAAQQWAQISADFDVFEASARAGTSDFLDSLAKLINDLSADVRVETSNE